MELRWKNLSKQASKLWKKLKRRHKVVYGKSQDFVSACRPRRVSMACLSHPVSVELFKSLSAGPFSVWGRYTHSYSLLLVLLPFSHHTNFIFFLNVHHSLFTSKQVWIVHISTCRSSDQETKKAHQFIAAFALSCTQELSVFVCVCVSQILWIQHDGCWSLSDLSLSLITLEPNVMGVDQ